jgi:hypothetical protein
LHRQLVYSQLLATSIIPSSSKGLLGGVGKTYFLLAPLHLSVFERMQEELAKDLQHQGPFDVM